MSLPPDLVTAIREEIRSAFWLDPPQSRPEDWPHDIEAERHVIASMMDSDDAHDLIAEDFFAPIHRRIFTLLRKTPRADRIAVLLRELKSDAWRDDHIRSAEDIFRFVPIQIGKPLRESIASVVGCARRRRAISHMRRALAILTTADDADGALREIDLADIELRP